jgi:hypothetical protein
MELTNKTLNYSNYLVLIEGEGFLIRFILKQGTILQSHVRPPTQTLPRAQVISQLLSSSSMLEITRIPQEQQVPLVQRVA